MTVSLSFYASHSVDFRQLSDLQKLMLNVRGSVICSSCSRFLASSSSSSSEVFVNKKNMNWSKNGNVWEMSKRTDKNEQTWRYGYLIRFLLANESNQIIWYQRKCWRTINGMIEFDLKKKYKKKTHEKTRISNIIEQIFFDHKRNSKMKRKNAFGTVHFSFSWIWIFGIFFFVLHSLSPKMRQVSCISIISSSSFFMFPPFWCE